MPYVAKCNLRVERGVEIKAGQEYTGPEDLIEQLLKNGLIEEASQKDAPRKTDSVKETKEEKPKKKRKKA